MPGGSRSLPGRPSLRYLRVEAKRRLTAGEFATLHDAQTAIAREHGQPSWAALKQVILVGRDGQPAPDGHALAQLRWVISRFSGADETGWAAPGEDELRLHFSSGFLDALPPARLVEVIGKLAADLRSDLVVIGQAPLEALVELNGVQYIAVRELLSHTAGVDDPTELYAHAVADLATLMGPVIGCGGPRGMIRPSNGGIAVLGQLVADVTALPYADAATQLVLTPLGLRDSSFPARPADVGPGAVTSYNLGLEGIFEPIPAVVSTLQAVAGLWSTGADLVRLGLGWSSLLPESLAHEALTPQASQAPPAPQIPQVPPAPPAERAPGVGLGWLISPRGDLATHAGGGLEGTADLTIRIRDNRLHVVLTSRLIPINSIDVALLRAWTNPPEE